MSKLLTYLQSVAENSYTDMNSNRLSRKERLSSSLYASIEDNRLRYVHALVADPDCNPNWIVPEHGITPFHLAIGHENKAFARNVTTLLLDHGGDPNVRSVDGMTPVHVAAAWGRTRLLELLLLAGGDPWIKDNDWKNAFQYADEENRWRATKLLESYRVLDPRFPYILDKVFLDNGIELELHAMTAPALPCHAVATQTSPREDARNASKYSHITDTKYTHRDEPRAKKELSKLTCCYNNVRETDKVYQYPPSTLSEGEVVMLDHSSSVTLDRDCIYETNPQSPNLIDEEDLQYQSYRYLRTVRTGDGLKYRSQENLPRTMAKHDLGHESYRHLSDPSTKLNTGINLPNLMTEIATAALRSNNLTPYMSEIDFGYDDLPSLVSDLTAAALCCKNPPRFTNEAEIIYKNLPSTTLDTSQVLPAVCRICQVRNETTTTNNNNNNHTLCTLHSAERQTDNTSAWTADLETSHDSNETDKSETANKYQPQCSATVRVRRECVLDELKDRQAAGLKGATHQVEEALVSQLVEDEAMVDVNPEQELEFLVDELHLPGLERISSGTRCSDSDIYESAEEAEDEEERQTLVPRSRTSAASITVACTSSSSRLRLAVQRAPWTKQVYLKRMRQLASRMVHRVSSSSNYHKL